MSHEISPLVGLPVDGVAEDSTVRGDLGGTEDEGGECSSSEHVEHLLVLSV